MKKLWSWFKNLFKEKAEPQVEVSAVLDAKVKTPYDFAKEEMGVKEITGSIHNDRILQYHQSTSLKATTDEISWCASFVNWCLGQAEIEGTNKANARSFLNWGRKTKSPKEGDIVVFYRGKKSGWQGHVAFFVKMDGKYIICLGGNQKNKVCEAKYPKKRLLGYRTYL